MKRLLVGVLVGVLASIPFASGASAGMRTHPVFTNTQVSFQIPITIPQTATWTLRLWSHSSLVGSASGTSGVISVTVPSTPDCKFQADVKETPVGSAPLYYSGTRVHLKSCGSTGID